MNPYNLAGPSSSPSSSSSSSPRPLHSAGPSTSRSGPNSSGAGGASLSASTALGPLVEPHQELNDFLETFWTRQMDFVEREQPDFRTYPLPLARIKKVMKSDEEVKVGLSHRTGWMGSVQSEEERSGWEGEGAGGGGEGAGV